MTEPTKRPWQIDDQGRIYFRPDPLTKYVIAQMESGDERLELMIRAAPALLAAAEALMSSTYAKDYRLVSPFKELSAAIKLAKGEA